MKEIYRFSPPGRTEISGNHTDHQHGWVLVYRTREALIKSASADAREILIQPKVLKMREYFVYFPFSVLHGWIKRSAVQPQTIYSEVP